MSTFLSRVFHVQKYLCVLINEDFCISVAYIPRNLTVMRKWLSCDYCWVILCHESCLCCDYFWREWNGESQNITIPSCLGVELGFIWLFFSCFLRYACIAMNFPLRTLISYLWRLLIHFTNKINMTLVPSSTFSQNIGNRRCEICSLRPFTLWIY